MAQPGVFGGKSRLVLESVGTADAVALRAIRQLVPGAIQDAARLVYQAPSELTSGLHAAAAEEMQQAPGDEEEHQHRDGEAADDVEAELRVAGLPYQEGCQQK